MSTVLRCLSILIEIHGYRKILCSVIKVKMIYGFFWSVDDLWLEVHFFGARPTKGMSQIVWDFKFFFWWGL